MYSKTRDLEIVYNLLWKSKPHQSDDRANIVGMYDIPSTTLNWETFKSYLLKNSGSNANDIKVSYIDSDEKEVPINSQNDFQLALYSFRRRARIGEIITLKLDKLHTRKTITQLIQSTDAEIQTHEYKDEATQQAEKIDDENPPKWFTKHLKKFEKKMMEEMKQQFTLFGSKVQTANCQHSYPSRSKATKPDAYKRSRKFDLTKVNMDKDLCKQYKFEKKLESKLEKLEHKTTKIKAKKLSAMKVSSDSDAGRAPCPKNYTNPTNELGNDTTVQVVPPLNSVILNNSTDKLAGPLYTNSVYLQKWEVTNCGQSTWDDQTELRYAWGSEKLRPTFTILKCPELQPGEKGEISVWFQIPSTPGSYECYWHFYDCGRRFGHWIGCQLTVIDYPIAGKSIVADVPVKLEAVPIDLTLAQCNEPETGEEINKQIESLVLETRVNNLDYTSNFEQSSDSDNISILSATSSSPSGSSDYVVVQSPDSNIAVVKCIATKQDGTEPVEVDVYVNKESLLKVDTTEAVEDQASTAEAVRDTISTALKEYLKTTNECDLAYIDYNGEKHPVHKDLPKPANFTEAEKCNETQQSSSSNVSQEELGETQASTAEVATDMVSTASGTNIEEREVKIAETETSDFAYIYYNGEKYPFHKDLLRPEYFTEAEKCNEAQQSGSSNVSHEELAMRTSEFSESSQDSGKRLFVFPRHSPGFEVVYPAEEAATHLESPSSYEADYYDSAYGFFPAQSTVYGLPTHPLEVEQQITSSPRSSQINTAASPTTSHDAHPQTPASPTYGETRMTTSTTYTSPQMSDSEQPKFNGRVYRPAAQENGKRENIITEAAIFASSAMSTARNVVNMVINTGNGKWVNGHWKADSENTKRENGLKLLAEMGFMNRDLNATLLARYNDDVHRVISELVQ